MDHLQKEIDELKNPPPNPIATADSVIIYSAATSAFAAISFILTYIFLHTHSIIVTIIIAGLATANGFFAIMFGCGTIHLLLSFLRNKPL